MTPNEYKKFKGLKNQNLRDHMTDLELIFNMLGEASTSEIERTQNPEKNKRQERVLPVKKTTYKKKKRMLERKRRRKRRSWLR